MTVPEYQEAVLAIGENVVALAGVVAVLLAIIAAVVLVRGVW